jgi:hypothetical protein
MRRADTCIHDIDLDSEASIDEIFVSPTILDGNIESLRTSEHLKPVWGTLLDIRPVFSLYKKGSPIT